MRKTFLKVALIGLLVGSLPVGFTSCKDYDDDIEQTNNQVADLKTKLASVETAIAALPSKADVTAAQAAAVAQAKADLEAVKAELQKAIDGKADKEAVEAINTELNSIKGQLETIEALKGQVSEAMDAINASIDEIKADAVTKGQMIAGLEGQIADLKKAQEEGATNMSGLTDELTALKAAVEDPTSGIAALKAQIEELAKQINGEGGDATSLEAVVRLMNGMITHIEVVTNGNANFDTNLNLFVVDVTEDFVFGKGLPGEITFTKGQEMLFTDSLLVRVSPANAVVTADQIQLVNSEGKDVSAFINVTEVKPFEGLLTDSRSIANNGLHVVKLELKKEYDRDAYQAATAVGEENDKDNVLFAVAVKDSEKELADNRDITSAYDVAIISEAPEAAWKLDYTAADIEVANIRNRFQWAMGDYSSFADPKNLVGNEPQSKVSMEDAYKNGQAVNDMNYTNVQNQFQWVGDYAYTAPNNQGVRSIKWDVADNRNGGLYWNNGVMQYAPLAVNLGKKFTVDLSNAINSDGIYGFYVELDMLRATESDGSEATAWKAYENQIAGINQVVKGTSVDLCLNMKDVPAGEEIGFRVWAVNYDGTLVDPDGRAFYVQVGEAEAPAEGVINFAVVAKESQTWPVEFADDVVDASDQLTGDWMNKFTNVTAKFTLDPDQIGAPDVQIYFSDGSAVNSWYRNGEVVTGTTQLSRDSENGYDGLFEEMYIGLYNNSMVDGVTYTGKLQILNGTNVLQTIAINVVKNVPTAMPENAVVALAGQVDKDKNITAYLDENNQVNLNTIFKNIAPNNNLTEVFGTGSNKITATDAGILSGFSSKIINDNKSYALNITYTYYGVSYGEIVDEETGDVSYGYKNLEFTDSYKMSINTLSNAYKFAWGVANKVSKAPVLVQGESNNKVTLADIDVTSSMEVSLKTTLDKLEGVSITKVETTGDIAGYFKVNLNGETLEFKPIESNPVGQISGNLKITYNGEDGIACTKTLPIQMNVPQN